MLISALCDYYDTLAAQGKLLPESMSRIGLSYIISLKPDGTPDDIINCQQTEYVEVKGKQKEILRPKQEILPRRSEKSAIFANFIEHRPLYIFGLAYDTASGKFAQRTSATKDKAIKSHDAFVKQTEEYFGSIASPVAQAYLAFAKRWQPEAETGNPLLQAIGKNYDKCYYGFCLSGHPEMLLHKDPAVLAAWEARYGAASEDEEKLGMCAVSGERLPIARIHNKISGVPGGKATGNVLISFKNDSENSYYSQQSYNSNISTRAMQKYTAALNYLLADRNHRTTLDDMTILHWAGSADETVDDLFNSLLFNTDALDADRMDTVLKTVASGLGTGTITIETDGLEHKIDPNVTFYMVGIKPNAARLAVKFIYRQKFGKLLANILQHQQDMQIRENGRAAPLWVIRKELISPKSSNGAVDPATMTKILEAIIHGRPYPDFLLQTMVRRIRTDSDEEKNAYIKMNDTRIGVLKACINRDSRAKHQEEKIKMALDLENNTPAYLCGRLFAVLETIQQLASNNSLNRTIKDAYFSAAAARPATVFPKLIMLCQHHIAKLDNPHYWDKQVRCIIDSLGPAFPDTLSLKDQGTFMIGYYQQRGYKPSKAE